MNDQPDLFAARKRGHEAAKRSSDHADRVRHQWTDTALVFVRVYAIKAPSTARFLTEEIRVAAEEWGLDAPPDGRAWGHVIQRAKRDGLIAAAGYAPAISSNGSPKVLWRSST